MMGAAGAPPNKASAQRGRGDRGRGNKRRILVTCAGAAVLALTPSAAFAATSALWNMGELSGSTMRDASGNGHDGTIGSGVVLGKAGYSGRAYGFTGNGAKVTVPHSSALNPGSGSFKASAYFKSSTKPSSSVGDYDLVRKGLGSTTGGDWKLEVNSNGHAGCHFRGSRTINLEGTTNVVNGSWHRITCVTDSTGTALKVDGSVQSRTSSRSGSITNTSRLTVGAKSNGEDSTTGSIDLVTITKS